MSQIYGCAVAVLARLGEEKSGLNTVLGLVPRRYVRMPRGRF